MKKLNIDEVLLNEDFKEQIHCPEFARQILTDAEIVLNVDQDLVDQDLNIKAYIYANKENSEFLLELYNDDQYFISNDISELQKKATEWVYETTLAASHY